MSSEHTRLNNYSPLEKPRAVRPPLPSITELVLTQEVLDQAVAYTTQDRRIYSLGEYLTRQDVPRVESLSESELQQVVRARLSAGLPGRQLMIPGIGSFDESNLHEAVKKLTPLGNRLLSATRSYLGMLETMIDEGRFLMPPTPPPS